MPEPQQPLRQSEYELLNESIKALAQEIKELRNTYISKDIMDLRLVNLQLQIDTLKTQQKEQEQRAISSTERLWLRIGTAGGLIGVSIAIMQYLTNLHR